MATRIAIFNHKGGTGKTISAYNIGWKLTENGKRVLLVDGDSQVNLTALSLGFDRFDEYYDDENTKFLNIKDGLSSVFEGKPSALEAFDCPTSVGNDQLFVLPGHADLASYEGQLSLAQETAGSLSVLKNLPGAIQAFISLIEERHAIDFTIIDLNPGLGAINQNFFIASDAFIVPTNPDPFSLMAIETLATHLVRWIEWKRANFHKFEDADYTLHDSSPMFLGTINSRFNRHASKAAKKYDERIREIDNKVENVLFPKLQSAGMTANIECYLKAFELCKDELPEDNTGKFSLARVPDFQALIHTANIAGVPVYKVDEEQLQAHAIGGVVKENSLKNVQSFDIVYSAIAKKIELLTNHDSR